MPSEQKTAHTIFAYRWTRNAESAMFGEMAPHPCAFAVQENFHQSTADSTQSAPPTSGAPIRRVERKDLYSNGLLLNVQTFWEIWGPNLERKIVVLPSMRPVSEAGTELAPSMCPVSKAGSKGRTFDESRFQGWRQGRTFDVSSF